MKGNFIIATFYIGQIIAVCISAYYAIKLLRLKNAQSNLKFFAFYPILAISIGIPNIINDFAIKNLRLFCNVLQNVTLLLHISLIGYFIYSCLNRKLLRQSFFIVLSIFQVILLIYLSSIDITRKSFFAFAITNFGLIILTLFYFFEIFINPPILKLTEEPHFWIVTGVFFSMCLSMPFFATYKVILQEYVEFVQTLVASSIALSFIIMHLFFVKGFKCSIKNQNI